MGEFKRRVQTGFVPRRWQREAADRLVALAQNKHDRALVYACPGSGKTFGGLLIAGELISRAKCGQIIIVVTPSLEIKSQWITRARETGLTLLEIKHASILRQPTLPFGVHGYIMSYQQAVNLWITLRHFCEENEVIAILDEVHHTCTGLKDRDGNTWGEAVSRAFDAAKFKVCMTGTPFREGNHPIAFVNYNEIGEAVSTASYSYAEAIRDGVCRPLDFEMYDGGIAWISRATRKAIEATFQDKLTKRMSRERLEAAISLDGDLPAQMLAAANSKLLEIRSGDGIDAVAVGLIIADNIDHAQALQNAMAEICGQRPILVHSKIDDAQDLIDSFRGSDHLWIIGVSMLSEGVDIPRLRVGVYASRIRAALYIHQALGRLTRVQGEAGSAAAYRERSFVFLPRDPDIEEIVREFEREKYHALGEEMPVRAGTGGRGRKNQERETIEVVETSGRATLHVFGGMGFSDEYRKLHRPMVNEIKRKNPNLHGVSETEILKLMVDMGVIPSPETAVAVGEAA